MTGTAGSSSGTDCSGTLSTDFNARIRSGADPRLIPGTTVEELTTAFDEAREAGGDFCLATHYWEVDAAMKNVLLKFLDYAARDRAVRFVAAEELFA